MKISLAMIVKNEEAHLKRCLESVKGVVDEIVIVDTGSTDKTIEIGKMYGGKIYDFIWADDFSKARNYSLEKATGDWILVLDADEWLQKDYKHEIQKFIQNGEKIGRVNIKSKFESDGVVHESNCFTSRLFPKGIYYEGRIHEQLISDAVREDIDVDVLHDGYFKVDKTSRNIALLEKELSITPYDPYFLYQLGKEYRNKKDFTHSTELFSEAYCFSTKNERFFPQLVVEYLNSLRNSKMFEKGLEMIELEQLKLSFYSDFYFAVGSFYMDFLQSNPELGIHQLYKIEKAYHSCLNIGENPKLNTTLGTGSFLASYNLGVFYEVLSDKKEAAKYYKHSATYNYLPAIERLKSL